MFPQSPKPFRKENKNSRFMWDVGYDDFFIFAFS